MTRNTRTLRLLVPTMLTFFTMGFVDSVGIATNYIKDDFALSDTLANLCPSMVFFWFLVCSVPTGMLMNHIGRARTVRLSVAVTALALLAPVIDYSFATMMVSFSLLGIGNALMQVSLNPLVSSVVTGDRLASTLTFGQFVKAIASFVAPLIAAWGVLHGASWRILFPVFAAIAVIALVYMSLTRFPEASENRRSSTFGACFALLRKPFILLAFLGILCHVGIDVGTNVTAPKLLIERLGMELTDAGYATSLYFLFRTLGCLSGSLILTRIPAMRFFLFSVGLMLLAAAGLFCLDGKGRDLRLRGAPRLRQLEHLPDHLLAGDAPPARQAERGLGADDHGTDRRHGLSAADGRPFRRPRKPERLGSRHRMRRTLPAVVIP